MIARLWFQTDPAVEVAGADQNFYLYLLVAAVVVGVAVINRRIAAARHRDPATWYWLGVIFPVVSLILLLALPALAVDEGHLRRISRRQMVGIAFGLIGIVLVFVLAPNLITETRSFAFEKPVAGAQLQVGFNPSVLVLVIGIVYWIVAGLSFLPDRHDRVSMVAQIIAAMLAVPLIVGIGLALSANSVNTNVMNLFDESLVLATPIALGAMTGLWSERVGIINIGIEGMMLAGAGVGFTTYAVLGQSRSVGWLWFSILIAVLSGAALAMLLAFISIRYNVNQIVGGVVINILAIGLTGFLRSQVIVTSGYSKGVATAEIAIPGLSKIPIVGETFFTGRPIHFLMYVVVFLTWLVMFRTAWGLRVRSAGENPHAAETLGIDVVKLRYQSVLVGGLIAGLAGAWFSMESQSGFEDNMTNAAGFIALAAMIFGKWTPWGAFGGAMLFGFARALGTRLQFLDVEIGGFGIPSEFFQAVPFIVTLVVVAGALGRAIPPAAEGQPYTPAK
ncbi:MAG: ABC transporter permease [Actinobacteria bacterium]|nr:ABC transporter permease [Actinomycetota bacterium]MBU1494099.1 ABC transporter permease [Actinomycetota bacterium]